MAALSARVGRAVLEIAVDDAAAKEAFDAFVKQGAEAEKQTRGISQAVNVAVFKELASVVGGAFKAIVSGVAELGERGAAVDDVAGTFEVLTNRTKDTASAMLGELRAGVAGTISDFELMKMANGALGTGMIKSASDMGTLASGARALSEHGLGETKAVFETLMSTINSGRTTQLKQLGIFVDSKVALEDYAKSHHKNVSALTDSERAQALAAATLRALKDRQAELGPITDDWSDRVAKAKTAVTNFTDQLAVGISRSPVFARGLEAAGKGLQAAFSANQGQAIGIIVDFVEELAIEFARFGRLGLSVAEWIATAFQSTKIAVNTVLAVVYDAAGTVNDFLAGLAQRASTLPVVGRGFALMAQEMRASADGARNMAQGFRDLANEQATSTVKMQDAFKVAKTVVDGLIGGMVKGSNEVAATAATTKKAIVGDMAGGTNGEAGAKAKENATAIGDAYRKLDEEVKLLGQTGIARRLAELEFQKQEDIRQAQARNVNNQAQLATELALLDQKYALLREKAVTNGTDIKTLETQLLAELELLHATDLEKSLARIEQERQAKLLQLEGLKLAYPETYAALTKAVTDAYGRMAAAALVKDRAEIEGLLASGAITRDEYERRAAAVEAAYERIKAAGLVTAGQLKVAEDDYNVNSKKGTDDKTKHRLTSEEAIKTGALQIYGVLASKYKEIAIAGAIVDTYRAISKAYTAAPWPANLVLAAGAAAAGWANVSNIRGSQAGFEKGTPGLDFMNFGAMSWQPLHHEEAVIPRGGGHLLASEIADSMPENTMILARLDRLIDLAQQNPKGVYRAFRDAQLFAV